MKADKFFEKDENTLAIYLKEINRIPLLSREDEEKYATLAAQGDKDAREILIKSNLRFVVNVAKKFRNKGLPMSDLINEGNIGLINAIEKYDVTRGYHFISYAVWWIRQAILKAIGEKSKMIRLPLNRFGELVQIDKARKVMYEALGREPDASEIAEHLNMDRRDVAELLNISREYVSLDAPVKAGTRDASLVGDFIEDKNVPQPEDAAVNESLRTEVGKLLEKLPEKEAAILKQRYGLGGEKPKSLKEIGDLFHLTKERIRQIEKRAILRLKAMPMTQELQAYAC
ncbi:MAG: sigma-70 family RNA polymerase sigma factor [Spirochaetia bacterium]|nr:sigma-70 family RNA polymerase sigma factor [Spirochaetales bacterium]MBR5915927.1 sigma-70 family RNA polymerase sigma factor [Spirochaetia bacterium]